MMTTHTQREREREREREMMTMTAIATHTNGKTARALLTKLLVSATSHLSINHEYAYMTQSVTTE